MLRMIRCTLLWACTALTCTAVSFGMLICWPDPLFAFSLRAGKIVVASDRPIPTAGGERFLRAGRNTQGPRHGGAVKRTTAVASPRW